METFLGQCHGIGLIQLACQKLGALGLDQILDPMIGIGGQESDDIARLNFVEPRLDGHAAFLAKVQHPGIVAGAMIRGGSQRRSGRQRRLLHEFTVQLVGMIGAPSGVNEGGPWKIEEMIIGGIHFICDGYF